MSLYDDASLVMVPSGYKDTKLYSAKPTNGDGDFTFSRGSNLAATRVNSEGLIEKGRENVLVQSNSFDTTWASVDTTETSGQSGYDGSSDAWLLSKTASAANIEQGGLSGNGVHTFSVYAKAGTLNWLRLVIAHTGTNPACYYDLANGVIGTPKGNIDATITSVGDGWYRCSLTGNLSSLSAVRIYPADADEDTGGTSGNIIIQDAQLELGLVSTDVITTTTTTEQAGILEDMPRLDYSGGASCPSLLLEPQRTNVVTNSEYISSISDLTIGNGTISSTSNYAISPEGVKNATRIVASATGTSYALKTYTAPSSVSGNYTCSMYIKSNTSSNQSINFYARGGNNVITVTPEWQRFVVVGVGYSNFVNFGITQASGQENIDILVYGLQMEQDVTYPTSYIPTYGAISTRSQDSCSKTGISSLIGQTEGTMFLEVDYSTLSGLSMFLSIRPDASNKVEVYRDGGTIYGEITGSTSFALTSSAAVGTHKIAFAYKSGSSALYIDGFLVGQSTTAFSFTSSLVDIAINSRSGGAYNEAANYNEAIVFPTRLTNDELADLTTL